MSEQERETAGGFIGVVAVQFGLTGGPPKGVPGLSYHPAQVWGRRKRETRGPEAVTVSAHTEAGSLSP